MPDRSRNQSCGCDQISWRLLGTNLVCEGPRRLFRYPGAKIVAVPIPAISAWMIICFPLAVPQPLAIIPWVKHQVMSQRTRRFPAPWTVEQIPGGYKVLDANGQSLAYVHESESKANADIANVLTMDEARTHR